LSYPIEFPLPSLEEANNMDMQRSEAIESLQIADGRVKCQKCSMDVPLLINNQRPKNHKIELLQTRIKWIEEHRDSHCHHTPDEDIQRLKQELAELQAADSEYDKLRSIPLYSSKITGFKFVCDDCFNNIYRNKKKKRR
jgi:hypothetical protein